MAKKVTIQGTLQNLTDAWGGVSDGVTPVFGNVYPAGTEWGMNRGEVERFIKSQFDTKTGWIQLSSEKVEGFYHIYTFRSQAEAVLWALDPEQYSEYLLNDIPIPISDVQGTTYSLRLATNSNRESIVSIDGNVVLGIKLTSTKQDTGQTAQDNPVTATLNIYGRGNSSASWALLGTRTIDSVSQESTTYQNVDISELVPSDNNGYQVRLIAVVNSDEFNATSNTLQFNSVTKTKLSLRFGGEWWEAIEGGEGLTYGLPYFIGGTVNKKLYLEITGKTSAGVSGVRSMNFTVGESTHLTQPRSFDINDNNEIKVLSVHGVHRVEAWLALADDPTVQSEHVITSLMVVVDEDDNTPHLLLQNVKTELTNYVSTDILEYAVYRKSGNTPVEFVFSNMSGSEVYFRYPNENVAPNSNYTLTNAIEIEDDTNDTIAAYMRVTSNGVDLLSEIYGQSYLVINVDNSMKFAPTRGAAFFLNPKTRNNSENNPQRVINAVDESEISNCIFNNFAFIDGVDGWTQDEAGQPCLRIPAGRSLTIPYEIFSDFISRGTAARSMTLELDFAVRNIADEATPIFSVCTTKQGKPLGIEMKPLEGVFMTTSQTVRGQQNFAWQEDVRTRITFNIVHNLVSDPTTTTALPYVRIFINGVINREFKFDSQATQEEFVQYINGAYTSGGIRIGQADSDIDIYSIRVYNKGLSSDDVLKDYIATLPTAEEKLAFRSKNQILQNEQINYSTALGMYNVIVWHGRNVSNHSAADKQDSSGWMYIHMLNDDLSVDMAHSGTLTDLSMKGQGTTAKHYYEWNIQVQWKGETGSFTDLNGDDHGQKYQIAQGEAWAKKLVGKINYASSMQSHKEGATSLYNDLYRRICGSDKQILVDNPSARVAVLEKPFLYFVQGANDPEPVFQGLMTFGAGKMDKPTWGYDKTLYPDFVMLEGADNNALLTDMRAPWDSNVVYDPNEESFTLDGVVSLDFDAGPTEEIDGAEYPKMQFIQPFIDAWNFLYEHNPFVTFFEGSLEGLKQSNSVDTGMQYWVRDNSDLANRGDLFRYTKTGERTELDANGQEIVVEVYDWIPVVRRNGSLWVAENIITDWGIAYTGDLLQMNNSLIAKRRDGFRNGIEDYFFKNDLLFNHEFIKLIAGTDNRSKNTYYVTYPKVGGGYRIALHADDLDTIFLTNNVGWQSKPYYVEEQDAIEDISSYEGSELTSSYHWEGQKNVLYRLVELAYESELPQMMNTILDTMAQQLVTETDVNKGIEKSPFGCFQKYFFSIQEYFPAVAYNETARIRYETAQLAVEEGRFSPSRGVQPITQSLGDQLECEKEFIKKRLVYLSTYAYYGVASNGLNIQGSPKPNGQAAPTNFNLTAHQWLYPTGSDGTTPINPHYRLRAGGNYTINLRVFSGDTSKQLNSIDYYSSIGNCSQLSLKKEQTFILLGKRLTEFIAEPEVGQTALFRPQAMTVSAGVKLLKTFNIRNCTEVGGQLNLSNQTRLQTIDIRGTAINGLVLPQTNSLTTVHLPATLTSIVIENAPNLVTLDMEGGSELTRIIIKGSSSLNTYAILNRARIDNAQLNEVELHNINWTGVDASFVEWLTTIPSCRLTGTITIGDAVSFDLRMKMIAKWNNFGQVGEDGLIITHHTIDVTDALVTGDDYIWEVASYQFKVAPTPPTANNFTSVSWSVVWDDEITPPKPIEQVAEIDQTGFLIVKEVFESTNMRIKVIVTIDGISYSKVVGLYYREAQLGDYVYSDGTWSDNLNPLKSVIGICFCNEVVDGFRYRLMVGLSDLQYTTRTGVRTKLIAWGLASNSIAGVTPVDNDAYFQPNNKVDGNIRYVYDIPTINNETGLSVSSTIELTKQSWIYGNFYEFKDGDTLPMGQIDTLKIIRHRNMLLNDSSFSSLAPVVPRAHDGLSEYSDIESQMGMLTQKAIDAELTSSTAYYLFYYPAVSFCFAYEPSVEEGNILADRFKAHNWWLPSQREICRLGYYAAKGYTVGTEGAIFAKAKVAGIFNSFIIFSSVGFSYNGQYRCTNEYGYNNQAMTDSICLRINASSAYMGYTGYNGIGKSTGFLVRPICKF